MAITLSGSTIEIDSGVGSGTATGGTSTTLTGSGFGSWANRIVWITSGTGAGQSRFIRTATSTTLTVEPNWDINPAAGSVFSIGYTWADIDAAMASVTVSSANFYLVPNNLNLKAGGFIGSINEHVRFTVSVPTLTSAQGSLWQQGRLLSSGVGVGGGAIEIAYAPVTGFNENPLRGLLRWYRAAVAALPGGGNFRVNDNALATSFPKDAADLRDVNFNNVYVVAWTGDRVERCTLASKPFWSRSAPSAALSQTTYIENSFIIAGDFGLAADSHYFGLTFQGIPQDPTFSHPYWVWNTTTKEGTYFWDTAAPAYANTFAASLFWPGTPSAAGFHTGYTVNLAARFAAGGGASDTIIGLWDSSGNAAWFEGVNAADGRPVNSLTITTNASGNYANPHPAVAGRSGLVVAQRVKSNGATSFGPWTVRARKYGYLEAGGSRSYTNGATETLFMVVDAAITQASGSTVAAYTEIDTSAKLYDRYQHHLSLAANIKTDNGLTRSGSLINAGSYNVVIDATAASAFALVGNTITIKASAFTGDMTTTGLITLANGATFVGTRTDANGTVAPPKTVSITGITAGSRLQIYNVTTAAEVVNAVVAGTSYSATYNEGTGYTTGDIVRVRLAYTSGTTAKLPYSAQAVVGASGWSVLAEQQDDTVYATLGIDGSTVTEFAPDYPNVQVDINDPDGSTRVDRLYAWFVHTQSSNADGIRLWFGGIVPEDAANFRIVTSVLNLKIDNVSATGVTFTDGRRLYRDDDASPLVSSTTGGGSITFFAGKVYTVNIGGSALTPSESAKLMGLPAAESTATAVRGELATELGRIDVAVSTRATNSGAATATRTELATELSRLDASVSSRLAASSYVTPPTASAIRTEIDDNSTKLDVAVSTRNATAPLDATATAAAVTAALNSYDPPTKGELDSAQAAIIAAMPASAPSASQNAAAVRTELTTELSRIDVGVSTRLASDSYTAPDNTEIAAIKAVTDKLDSTLVLDGSVYQFTANALENGSDAVMAKELETGFSVARTLRIVAASTAGKVTGGPDGPIFRNLSDTANQITGVATEDGNRTSATYGT